MKVIVTQRMTINGRTEEELEKRIEELKNRGYRVVTPVTEKSKMYYEHGKNGRYNHTFNYERSNFIAVLEREWDHDKKTFVTVHE